MTGDSWRERRRALLGGDQAASQRAARLLDAWGTEERDDEEIEAEHRASRLAAAREYAPNALLEEELQLRLTGPDADGGALHFRVRFRQQLDSMGIARSTEYTYLGPAAEQPALPLEP
ncbi:hypothetical protein [Streptomyces sp. NPDC058683]|uniref:hypothetical protein n=1 Tax=Streptomyces sp. NPDC058683 TaxID=3346597 RepID=UPI00364D62E4